MGAATVVLSDESQVRFVSVFLQRHKEIPTIVYIIYVLLRKTTVPSYDVT